MKSNQSLSQLNPDFTLGQIISADREAAQLLASIGLNLSSNENKTLREVCTQKQWNEVEVMNWIKKNHVMHRKHPDPDEPQPDVDSDLLSLYNYIDDEIYSVIPALLTDIQRDFPIVFKIHGNQYTWLKNIQWHFNQLEEFLTLSLEFRKEKLFPLIGQLQNRKNDILDGTRQMLERSVEVITDDREQITRQLKTLETLGNDFTLPEGACSTFRILIQNFKSLSSGLNRMYSMEKQLLIPAIQYQIKTL